MNLKPLHYGVLVKRLPLPELSQGNLFVIGRDYPTIGTVLRTSAILSDYIAVGLQVQWGIGTDFEYKLIGKDLLLFDYEDLNLIIADNNRAEGARAYALGDRLLVRRLPDTAPSSTLEVPRHIRTRWATGIVKSAGRGRLRRNKSRVMTFAPNDAIVGDTVIFDLYRASEITLSNQDYLIIRNDDTIATLERH